MQSSDENGYTLVVTSDHGHIERMINPMTGRPETAHHTSLVPFYLIGREFERRKTEPDIESIENEASGILSDIAPTILELLGLPKVPEMTGQSLLKFLR